MTSSRHLLPAAAALASVIISSVAARAFPHPEPAGAGAAAAARLQAGRVFREELSSGMRLLVAPRGGADVVALDLRVRGGGSASETAANSGAAHFLEHLVFKGGSADAPGALDAAFEEMGGEASAQTSRDFVTYSVTVPRAKWEQALALLARMVLSPALRPGDVEAERAIILSEMAVARGDARRLGIGALAGAAFPPGDPYRFPLLGTEASVGRLSADDLRAFHAARYRPAHFTLAVAGPVLPEAVRDAARAAFGEGRTETTASAAAGPSAPSAAPPPPDPAAPNVPLVSGGAAARPVRAAVAAADARAASPLNTVHLAFRAPSPHRPEDAALAETLAALLARGGDGGVLGRAMTAGGVAISVRAEYLPLRRGGLLLVSASGRRPPEELESALVAQITRLREDGIPGGALEDAKYARIAQAAGESDRVDTLAARLAYYDALDAPTDWQERHAAHVAAVTAEDAQLAAREWLAPARRTVVFTGPDAPEAGAATGAVAEAGE